jgi:hypothetical protein
MLRTLIPGGPACLPGEYTLTICTAKTLDYAGSFQYIFLEAYSNANTPSLLSGRTHHTITLVAHLNVTTIDLLQTGHYHAFQPRRTCNPDRPQQPSANSLPHILSLSASYQCANGRSYIIPITKFFIEKTH